MQTPRPAHTNRTARSAGAPSRVDAVRLDITRLVFRGALRIGDALPSERDLVALYGVSRGALRRVLTGLREDGVIRVSHGRRTMVTGAPRPRGAPPVAPSEQARSLLNRTLVAQRMNRLVELQNEADEVPQFVIADQLFCAELAMACDAESAGRIRELAERLASPAYREALEDPATRREFVDEYRAISDAVERGDMRAASAAAYGELQRRARTHSARSHAACDGDAALQFPPVMQEVDLQGVLMTWHR